MRLALGFTSAILAVLAGPLTAQDQPATISGVVRDAQGQPIAGAEIFAGRAEQPATSNPQGQFRIAQAPSGALWVMARKIGYAPVRRSVRVAKGENQVVDFTMEPLPVTLPEVKVVERSGFKSRRLEDFWRRSRGSYAGRFITRED
ncbi:MAG TPA: carboxypeptidase-like regulatory domain-containing protein, partial [Gemmatimonadales bacterium]